MIRGRYNLHTCPYCYDLFFVFFFKLRLACSNLLNRFFLNNLLSGFLDNDFFFVNDYWLFCFFVGQFFFNNDNFVFLVLFCDFVNDYFLCVNNYRLLNIVSLKFPFNADNVRYFAFASLRKFLWDSLVHTVGNNNVMAMSYFPKVRNTLWGNSSNDVISFHRSRNCP